MKKSEPKDCDHKGHIISGGLIPVSNPSGLMILVILVCSKCGAVIVKDVKIPGIGMPTQKMNIPISPDLLNKMGRKF